MLVMRFFKFNETHNETTLSLYNSILFYGLLQGI